MLAETVKDIKSGNRTKTGTDNEMDLLPGTSQSNKNTSNNLNFAVDGTDVISLRSMEPFACRICHSNENSERLISPCLCKGSLAYVHFYCLERWIGVSRCTMCELCHFQYTIEQTLRYSFYQSLRIWYSRPMSRRALQEDCQMLLLLSLIAFGIIGTLLIAVQFYILQGHISGMGRIWTKGWLIFFLMTTLAVYIVNAYLVIKGQLLPWYRWWQMSRDVRLILESPNPPYAPSIEIKRDRDSKSLVAQTAEIGSLQQDAEAAPQNEETQQKVQRADEKNNSPCENASNSAEIFSDNSNLKAAWVLKHENITDKLRFIVNSNTLEVGSAISSEH